MKGAKLRDSQRKKAYDAEMLFNKTHGFGRTFADKAEVEQYLQKFMATDWFKNRISSAPYIWLRLNPAGVRSSAYVNRSQINLSKSHMNEYILLHELSHLVRPKSIRKEHPLFNPLRGGHLWDFCATLLMLVRKQMGAPLADALEECFKKGKVRFRPKKKVQRSLDQVGKIPEGLRLYLAAKKEERQNQTA